LGLDLDTPLALLQWNSVLAVTYPARELYGIKRGDSWDAVRRKSNDHCLAMHLPILTTHQSATDAPSEEESVEDTYRKVYCVSSKEQQIARKELGVRRYNHEGKACLERYRLASSRIFAVVVDTLTRQLGRENYTLERASIDELFLDVTEYCWNNQNQSDEDAMTKTFVVGQFQEQDDDIQKALGRGCVVAHEIRKAILRTVGFTLSAGISTSKLVAKLGASYGKPNGQAVIYPINIPHVMQETEICKVRNLGGKIGKQVQALIPADQPTTMGSIAKLLSLPVLHEKLGKQTAKMVFDASRGLDEEPVRETIGALVKSITSFKSFSRTSITSGELTEWITLLATEVAGRVQLDASRNNRYPKSCTIQYSFSKESLTGRTTRSLRIPFPRDGDVKAKLVQRAKAAVFAKEGQVYIYRFGLCAMDFQTKMITGGISSFFCKDDGNSVEVEADQVDTVHSAGRRSQDEELARKLQAQYQANLTSVETLNDQMEASPVAHKVEADKDLELARKLQASYDRENYVLTAAEKRSGDRPKQASSKRVRIDNFFQKA
jgi:DNA polymerase eta